MPEQPSISGHVPLNQEAPQHPPPGAPSPAPPPPDAPQDMSGAHLAAGTAVAEDPFSRAIDLPSGGLYYENGVSKAVIRPTRGEQEEAIAGTADESPERVAMIRRVVEQNTDLKGLPFRSLMVEDFGAICLHLFALSAGTDEIHLDEDCPGCGRSLSKKPLYVTTLPCTYLRRAEPGRAPDPDPDEMDPALAAAMAVEREMGEDEGGPRYRYVSAQDAREPFRATLPGGITVEWRYLRMRDLEAAEEFVAQTGSREMGVGKGLGSYLSARQIVSLNGEQVGTVVALQWWRRTASPVLTALRDQFRARSFGYDMRPEVRCSNPECRRRMKVRLPNDGSLFRASGS